MQNDTVQIAIKDKSKAPHKVCKVRNQRPVTDKYELSPKMCPHLKEFVRGVVWNCAKQYLKINVYETPRFEAYDWLSTINDRKKDAQKSPFCDLEDDAILLKVLDECDKEVANFRFVDLELIAHSCEWISEHQDDAQRDFLMHRIKVGYRKVLKVPDKEPFIEEKPSDEMIDLEWKSKEVPE